MWLANLIVDDNWTYSAAAIRSNVAALALRWQGVGDGLEDFVADIELLYLVDGQHNYSGTGAVLADADLLPRHPDGAAADPPRYPLLADLGPPVRPSAATKG